MATVNSQVCHTKAAGADLSAAQFKVVVLGAGDTVTLSTAITDIPYGILQNKPTSGQAATICVGGESKFIAQGTVDEGEILGLGTTDGGLDQVATTNYPVGICTQAAGDTEIGSVWVNLSYTATA